MEKVKNPWYSVSFQYLSHVQYVVLSFHTNSLV